METCDSVYSILSLFDNFFFFYPMIHDTHASDGCWMYTAGGWHNDIQSVLPDGSHENRLHILLQISRIPYQSATDP